MTIDIDKVRSIYRDHPWGLAVIHEILPVLTDLLDAYEERDLLRVQVERMRPVVEAALWNPVGYGRGPTDVEEERRRRLSEAVDSFISSKKDDR